MAGLVVSYFYLPATKPIFGILIDWNVHGGLLFSFLAMGITVGGLTEIFSVYLHKNGRWTLEDLWNRIFNFLIFGIAGSGEQPGPRRSSGIASRRSEPRSHRVRAACELDDRGHRENCPFDTKGRAPDGCANDPTRGN